jgi:hypothetical protein
VLLHVLPWIAVHTMNEAQVEILVESNQTC